MKSYSVFFVLILIGGVLNGNVTTMEFAGTETVANGIQFSFYEGLFIGPGNETHIELYEDHPYATPMDGGGDYADISISDIVYIKSINVAWATNVQSVVVQFMIDDIVQDSLTDLNKATGEHDIGCNANTIRILDADAVSGQTSQSGGFELSHVTFDTEVFLPITLSSFTGCMDAGMPQLAWTTQSETGNAGWNVYRAESDAFADAVLLTASLIAGAGTTSEPTDYAYTDEETVFDGMIYFYWLESISCSGQNETWGPVSIEIPAGNEEPSVLQIPVEPGVCNYPNPFNPSTVICLTLAESECDGATVNIYNSRGQLVKRLQAQRTAGEVAYFSAVWDGCDVQGHAVSSGIYFCRIQAGKQHLTHKMVMMK